ncbi:long-chain fatty acid transporter fat1 [Sporothrix epigloea]|uniref:Long-chain fatty acid transporter fat1 n=1 Tax=Sporothrix epigloea TaxID=1892477 RepID=A0ABP0D2F4_9PEZI
MPVPLAVSIPAAAAGLAYLNARSSFWYDALLVRSVLPAVLTTAWRRRKGTISVFYKLEENALSKSTANHPFLLFGDNSYTYAEVYDKALRYGNWWKETMGVKKDDVVALDCVNSDTFIFLWMGLWAIGAKPAFINYNLRDQALIHCIKTGKSKLMVVDPEVVEALTPSLREELSDVRIEVFTDSVRAQAGASKAIRYPDEERFEDKAETPAMLIFTSGTTGLPKAAVISWAKMITTGYFSRGWISLSKNDIYYTASP